MGQRLSSTRHRASKKFFGKMVMVGLAGAGKTTILHKLNMGDVATIVPDIDFCFSVKILKHDNVIINAFDCGNNQFLRPLWRKFFQSIQALIYVIDSNDRGRVLEARDTLHWMINKVVLYNVPLLVLANKHELPHAMKPAQIVKELGLRSFRNHDWHIQSTCALSGEGLSQGMDWLTSKIHYVGTNYLSRHVDSGGYKEGSKNATGEGSYSGDHNQGGNNASIRGLDLGDLSGGKKCFSYEQVMQMTDEFATQNIIGEGGFGFVYKGLMHDGKVVAVKQLKAESRQGDGEFKAEVEIISRVHHKHLVSLVGHSIHENQRMLIYEYVPNKTLHHHLHSKGLPVLDWPKRLKIGIGAAKGLAYLHEDCHPKIIHRDIKSENILLDEAFEAKVADFGLARQIDTTQTHVSTRVMGTFGYLAPEYALTGQLTDRSDVYSFGVVLLELITGRKPLNQTHDMGVESLVERARPVLIHAIETGDLRDLVDPRLENHYVKSEMLGMVEIATACVRRSAPRRPRMGQVVRALDTEGEIRDLSKGLKYGDSARYDSGDYSLDLMTIRRMRKQGVAREAESDPLEPQ